MNVVPSNVKLASSSSSPREPAITILLSVKSSMLALARVACPSDSSVPATNVLPLDESTVNLLVLISKLPLIPVSPVTSSVPAIDVLPVACATVKLVTPTAKVVPSNVKLASSSSSLLVPAITILLSVKSLTIAVLITTSPVPFAVMLRLPLKLDALTVFPSMLILSTSKSPVISTLITLTPCVYVNSGLSSNSPAVPAKTIRPAVRSETVALASVLSPVTPSVPEIVALSSISTVPPVLSNTKLPAVVSISFDALIPICIVLIVALLRSMSPKTASPAVPLNTSDVLVAFGINVNLPELSSKPKKPTLADVVAVSYQLNSIPRSLLSSLNGALSPPNVNTGSSTVVVVLLTVVVVPLTVKFPVIVKLPPTDVLPDATATLNVSLPAGPISKFVASKRKLASSSNSPAVPTITILSVVKSSTLALANVACTSTSNVFDTETSPVTFSSVPLNVKLALSSIAPAVPASTTLFAVKSLIIALASVLSPVTSNVPAIAVLPVELSTVNLLVLISKSPSIPVLPVTSNVPATIVLPVACDTEKFPVPILNVVPSNVKLASSSRLLVAPAITIRLFTKFSTTAVLSVANPSVSNVPAI